MRKVLITQVVCGVWFFAWYSTCVAASIEQDTKPCDLALKYYLSQTAFLTQPINWSSRKREVLVAIPGATGTDPYNDARQVCPKESPSEANSWDERDELEIARSSITNLERANDFVKLLRARGGKKGGLSPINHFLIASLTPDKEHALKEYALASSDPDLRKECLFREASLLVDLGRQNEALEKGAELAKWKPLTGAVCQLLAVVFRNDPDAALRFLKSQLAEEQEMDKQLCQQETCMSKEARDIARTSRLRRILQIQDKIEEYECILKLRKSRSSLAREKQIQELLKQAP
jgi:hypothetical protein